MRIRYFRKRPIDKSLLFLLLIIFFTLTACPLSAQEKDRVVQYTDSIPQKMSIANYRFNAKDMILPASLITIGAVGTAIDGMGDFHLFSRSDSPKDLKIDDYLEWGMLGWVFVGDLLTKEKHNWVDQLLIITLAEGLNAGMVQGLKRVADIERPDGGPHSFPSGHTANAFLGAHVAYKEFKDSSPVMAYSGYAIATFVAGARIYQNRHWLTDVIAGAGFGILSVELSYLIYFPIRDAIARKVNARAARNMVFAPMMNGRGGGIYFSYSF